MKNVLLVKETKAGETRVALLPDDIYALKDHDITMYVESGAGVGVGLSDSDYEKAGAIIRASNIENLFTDIDIIVRAKRPSKDRETEEVKYIEAGTVLVGALDPKEKNSNHLELYRQAKIEAYSIDYLSVQPGDPMNLLERMSQLTGKLALDVAIKKLNQPVTKVVIIGFGAAGKSAYYRASESGYNITVFCTREIDFMAIEDNGHQAIILEKNTSQIENNRKNILAEIMDAQVVISSARSNVGAPVLITSEMLEELKDIFIIDLAISDGGNVEGSQHDKDIDMGNHITVSNMSGYPKLNPLIASKLWSESSRLFLKELLNDNQEIISSAKVI
jgi:alanine dehydrogenase